MPAARAQDETPHDHVVLVELFTSQGCSTCPPADRLLSAVAGQAAGRVVTLAFHVDFWNSAGWTDPFSKREWTNRQIAYGKAFGAEQIYTPQAVIDGETEIVGSDAERLGAAIAEAASRPAAEIELRLASSGSGLAVEVEVTRPEELRSRRLDLMVALFETGLVTKVGRGENGGRTLHNDYVVRTLDRAARLASGGPARSLHKTSLRRSKDWTRASLGVAAFLQDPGTLAVRGAAVAALPAGGN